MSKYVQNPIQQQTMSPYVMIYKANGLHCKCFRHKNYRHSFWLSFPLFILARTLWLNFLSIISDFLKWEKMIHKLVEPKVKLQFLNDKIAKLQIAICVYLCKLHISNCSAFCSSIFCVSFSHEKKSDSIERTFKHEPWKAWRIEIIMIGIFYTTHY